MTTLLNYGLYQAGWLCCVLGAAAGRPWLGGAAALSLAGVHVALSDRPRRELRLLLAAGAVGFVADSAQTAAGLLRFDAGLVVDWLAPPWIVVMWLQFATTFHYCMRWLIGRPRLASVLGLIGGPLAFWSGHRLGAMSFGEPRALSLAVLGVVWAAALPLLLNIAARQQAEPGRYRGIRR